MKPPGDIRLNHIQLLVLDTLYRIEDHVVKAIQELYEVLHGPGPIGSKDLERAVSDIGGALKVFDDFDEGDNTVFAIFDELVHGVDNSPGVRSSSLQLTSEVQTEGQAEPTKVTKVFTSDMEVDVAKPKEQAVSAVA